MVQAKFTRWLKSLNGIEKAVVASVLIFVFLVFPEIKREQKKNNCTKFMSSLINFYGNINQIEGSINNDFQGAANKIDELEFTFENENVQVEDKTLEENRDKLSTENKEMANSLREINISRQTDSETSLADRVKAISDNRQKMNQAEKNVDSLIYNAKDYCLQK